MKVTGFVLVVVVTVCLIDNVDGHGRLIEPPSRSSAWRFGFDTPRNNQDNELFCGGFGVQQSHGGNCGVCGDPYAGARENEAGGIYATGTIVRTYKTEQTITLTSQLTANHKGWFEYRICPHNNIHTPITQACLDDHVLQRADGQGQRLMIPGGIMGDFSMTYRLPDGMTCSQCVIQWKYHAGNTWGTDPNDGHSCTGCGPQEEFYGCADVAISATGGAQSVALNTHYVSTTIPTTKSTTQSTTKSTTTTMSTSTRKQTTDNIATPKVNVPTTIPTTKSTTKSTTTATPKVNVTTTIPTTKSTTKSTTTATPKVNVPTTIPTTKSTTKSTTTATPKVNVPTTIPTTKSTTKSTTTTMSTSTRKQTTHNIATHKAVTAPVTGRCHAIGAWTGDASFDHWCNDNCARGFCPASRCKCGMITQAPITTVAQYTDRMICKATGASAGNLYMDRWCTDTCSAGSCPADKCRCSTVQIVASVTSTSKPDMTYHYTRCVPNGIVDGDYWTHWCQEECGRGFCATNYCLCS